MLGELLKYHFKPEFDGILQYFSPPQFYLKHLRVNKPEKKNPTETCKLLLVSQVKSYKYKNLWISYLTSENNNLSICLLNPYGYVVL